MSTVEETLAWEAEWRPRAATAAYVAAIASLAGSFFVSAAGRTEFDEADGFRSLPDTLGAAIAGREPSEPSLLVRQAEELGGRFAQLTAGTLLTVLGALAVIGVLTYLFRASRARNPQIGRAVGWSIAAALALYPLGHLLGEILTWLKLGDIADAASPTPGDVRDISSDGVVVAGRLAGSLGTFALALALVLTCLNAMRVGLLTRFLGILGILSGALLLLPPLAAPGTLVRSIWLVMLGLLLSRRTGAPPAWETGRAEPWPSQQELRERRDAVRAEHSEADPEAHEAPGEPDEHVPGPGEAGYDPGAARRKRKKRR